MSARRLVIAQVNTRERRGGAEGVARQLLDGYERRGHLASLRVGRDSPSRPDVHPLAGEWSARVAHLLSGPMRLVDRYRGLETFRYPKARRTLAELAAGADIVQLHNLHGGYFDLRVLPELSRRVTVVLTLHDAWLLSGHCAHSFDCDRWRTGCGSCPDLDIYPAVRRDATAMNWIRKREVFRRSRLYVATPAEWLAERVRASMLMPGTAELRVIPNGVDLGTFRPGGKREARAALDLDPDGSVLLLVGNSPRSNPFKDYAQSREAIARAAEALERDITAIVLGDEAPDEVEGRARFRSVAFVENAEDIARWYRAADLYVHAARADTFPTSCLEALACGVPVVATAVGGIPEQVRHLEGTLDPGGRTSTNSDEATGLLVPPGDAEVMARGIARLLEDEALRARLGDNAARDARLRFDAERQCDEYLRWFRSILERSSDPAEVASHAS